MTLPNNFTLWEFAFHKLLFKFQRHPPIITIIVIIAVPFDIEPILVASLRDAKKRD